MERVESSRSSDAGPGNRAFRARAVLRLAALSAILSIAIYIAYRAGLLTSAERAKGILYGLRRIPGIPFWFMGVYALTASFGVPPAVMTLAGGAVFGTTLGVLYSWIGAVSGAVGGYSLARWLGGNAIRQLLGRHSEKLHALLGHGTFVAIFRLRVNPVVPFNALNFASGLSKVPLRPYILASLVGVLPAILVYAYFADAVIAGATGARERAFWHIAIAGIVIIALSFGPSTWKRFFQRLS
jgi:uncharacterized membrane protein YdjX (TVP38/TMEM64 family)